MKYKTEVYVMLWYRVISSIFDNEVACGCPDIINYLYYKYCYYSAPAVIENIVIHRISNGKASNSQKNQDSFEIGMICNANKMCQDLILKGQMNLDSRWLL